MGSEMCIRDRYKAETNPVDNSRYYAYILCYVDDILIMHHDPKTVLKEIHGYMPLKNPDDNDLDRINGNTLWADAIAKEMRNVHVAFRILPKGETAPGGYKKIPCHMIFDVKMTDFARKARLVAGGHLTEAPAAMTYARVVSRKTVRIALTIAALNSLDVKTGDVMNAYITAPITEKVWTVLGPEFGDADCGSHAIIDDNLGDAR